jgi:hypothetical protein
MGLEGGECVSRDKCDGNFPRQRVNQRTSLLALGDDLVEGYLFGLSWNVEPPWQRNGPPFQVDEV